MTAPRRRKAVRRVLVTGPVGRGAEYAAAAVAAGWTVDVRELIRVEERRFDAQALPDWIDFVCVTSKHAAPALRAILPRHRSVPAGVVGEGTAESVRELGFTIAHGPARTALELGEAIKRVMRAGAVVLWPRGSLSEDLATSLRAAGAVVEDPVVYETSRAPVTDPLPKADAVFLASPSGVEAYRDRTADSIRAGIAIAIGPTTATALRASGLVFDTVVPLESPTPRAFGRCLSDLS
jgi:uroporphyrinogen-III synthase